MGAWDHSTFGNDSAADWAADLVDEGDVDFVRDTLTQAAETPPDDYLEADAGSEALAAAEVVAAAAGRPAAEDDGSVDALAWAADTPQVGSAGMLELALAAVTRIAGAESELVELWADAADGGSQWHATVDDLRTRLHPAPG